MTPIKNKAAEVKAWLDRADAMSQGSSPTWQDAWDYINNRWPDLTFEIRQKIVEEAFP